MPFDIKKRSKKYYVTRLGEVKGEYHGDGWDAVDIDKTQYLYPHGRNLSDATKGSDGNRKDEYILNNTVLTAIRTGVSGIFAGSTPPNEKWFKLADEDKELNESAPVAEYYQKCTDIILLDMNKSNFYSAMELVYKDLLTYSISNIIIDEDPERVFNFTHVPNGQFYIAVDSRGEVSEVYREFQMRARNVVAEYGEKNVSAKTVALTKGEKTGSQHVKLLHVIERNLDRDVTKEDNRNMPWRSVTMELDGDTGPDVFLRESGYVSKPNTVPRWSVSSGNIYGNGPGDIALGDVKQLQKNMSMLFKAIEKDIDPPVIAEDSVDEVNTGPNEITYVDKTQGRPQVEALYRVTTDISRIVALIVDLQERIKEAFFANLFFAQGEADPRETATLTIAKQRELLRLLGPAVQRMTPEVFIPIIERCFDIEQRLGRLPEPPDELHGRTAKIEIISSLTKAQELGVIAPIQELILEIKGLAEFWPESLDLLSPDESIREIERVYGIPVGIINREEVVKEIRDLRLQRQIEQQQAAEAQQAIEGAKQLSETDMGGDNALNALAQGGVA
jgi:hypothetical protein